MNGRNSSFNGRYTRNVICILSRKYALIKLMPCIFTSFSGNEHFMDRFRPTIIVFLFLVTAAMTGCNSEEDSAPVMPDHARVIDLSNAKSTYDEALNSSDTILEKDSQITASISDIIEVIAPGGKSSEQDLAARATFDDSIVCITGSAIKDEVVVIDDLGNITGGSGTVEFKSCVIDANVMLNGSISFKYSLIVSAELTSVYSAPGGTKISKLIGNIIVTQLDTGLDSQLNEIEISEETNVDTDAYVIKIFQYAYDSGTDGFTVQLANEIGGFNYECGPASGIIIINGGGGTRLRATYNGDSSLTLEVNIDNGVYTLVPGSPFYCGI